LTVTVSTCVDCMMPWALVAVAMIRSVPALVATIVSRSLGVVSPDPMR